MSELTATELVAGALAGDASAWEELLVRYGHVVRAVVRSYRLRHADAADAEQNTWLRAVERLSTVREPERVGAWLATTAGRECLAVLHRARREIPDDGLVDVAATELGPEAAVLRRERRQAVTAAVSGLGARHRELVDALFFGHDRSYVDIAASTGMPVGSIGPTRGRAVAELRRRMAAAGFGPEDSAA